MQRLRVRFDRRLTKVVVDLAKLHGMSKSGVILAAMSMYKEVSDLDSLSDSSQPQLRFSEEIRTLAQQRRARGTGAAAGAARAAGAGV